MLENQQLLEFGHLHTIQYTNQDNRDENCPAMPRFPQVGFDIYPPLELFK